MEVPVLMGDFLRHLTKEIMEDAKTNGWKFDWKEGGCYLQLESAEFVESVRGKKGRPRDEATDILYCLIGMCEEHGVKIEDVFEEMENLLIKNKKRQDIEKYRKEHESNFWHDVNDNVMFNTEIMSEYELDRYKKHIGKIGIVTDVYSDLHCMSGSVYVNKVEFNGQEMSVVSFLLKNTGDKKCSG